MIMKHIKLFEQFINENKQTVSRKGETYTVDFIKNKSYDKRSSPTWDLLLIDNKTKEIYHWPEVFSYNQAWTQGQGFGPSAQQWFLQTVHYGGVSQGSGQSTPSTPRFIDDQLEYIIDHWKGNGYSKDATKWFQQNVTKYPPKTKKTEIK